MKLCALAKGALTKSLVCAGAITELPDDHLLPGLVAIRSTGVAATIPMLELNGEPVELALRGYTAGSRITLEVRAGRQHFAVKAYARDPSLEAELYSVLVATGLGGGTVRAPPLLSWNPDLRLLALGWFDGPTAKDLIVAGHGRRAGEMAAHWIRRAVSLPVRLGRPLGAADLVRKMRNWVAALGAADPTLGAAATALAEKLTETQPKWEGRHLLHGTLYMRHLYDLGDGAGLIDWNRFGQGPLELDAGVFLSSVWQLGLRNEAPPGEVVHAEAAFLDGTTGLLDERALNWHRAAMLLRLANKINRRPSNDWSARAPALLAEAARLAKAAN